MNQIKQPQWSELKVKVSDLKPYEKNPRTISDQQFEKLKQSIIQTGYHQRIIAQPDLRVIGGHQRIRALTELGISEITVLIPDRELSEKEFNKLLIQDNIPFGEFEWSKLKTDFKFDDLKDWGMPVEWLAKAKPPLDDAKAEETPALQAKVISRPGDLWLLGSHRLLCGDSTAQADVERLLGGAKLSLIPTSPPYDNNETYERDKNRSDWESLINSVTQTWAANLMDGGVFALNMGNLVGRNNIGFCNTAMDCSGLKFHRRVVWKKPDGAGIPSHAHTHKNPVALNWHPMMVTEEISIYVKGNRRKPVDSMPFDTDLFSKFYTDCWQFSGVNSDTKAGHPASFPVILPKLLISFLSAPDDIIGEPFAGSGTTIIAAEQTGRIAYGMEISPAYCDLIVRRWQTFTGKSAMLEETGETFDAVEKSRS